MTSRRAKPTGGRHSSSRQRERDASGRAFERFVSEQNTLLSQQGLAYVFKVPVNRRYDGTPLGKVWVDYSGLLHTGRGVALECKRIVRATSFSFSSITEHQRVVLRRVARMSGLSAVLVCRENPDLETTPNQQGRDALRLRFGTRREYWLLPATLVDEIDSSGARKSFPFPKSAEPSPLLDGEQHPYTQYRIRPGETWLDAWNRIEDDE